MFKTLSDAVVGLTNSVFGEDLTYASNAGTPQTATIKGVFDNAFVDIEGVISLKPTLRVRLSDLPAVPGKTDTVTINAVQYRVMESREDGYGGTTLILQKA